MRALTRASGTAGVPAEKQLQRFIAKFDPKLQRIIHSVRKLLQKRLPTANELVWDNYNFFVIGYSATERPSDSVFQIVAAANGVGLAFYHGADLPDPHQILLGSGTQNRFIRLAAAAVLKRPEVQALLTAAIDQAKTPFPASGKGKVIIRSISAKQKPRRKTAD
jgi:hypothetical protein